MNTDNQDNNIDNNVSNGINNTNLNKTQGNMTDGTCLPNEGTNNQNIDMQGVENNTTISEPNIQNQSLIQEQVQVSSNVEGVPVQNEIQSVTPMETNTQMNTNISGMSNATIDNSQKNNKNLILIIIIIIILAVIIIGVVVLVMFLPKKNKVTSTNEYRGEPKTVYLYMVTGQGPDEHYESHDSEQQSANGVTYELVKTYDCKTSCPTAVNYDTDTWGIYDDGVFYEYFIEQDKFEKKQNELEYKIKNYILRTYGNYVVYLSPYFSDMEYFDFDFFDNIPANSEEDNEISIHGSLDTLKDGMIAMTEDGKIRVYHNNSLIHEEDITKDYFSFSKSEEFYILEFNTTCYIFTKEKKLPVSVSNIYSDYISISNDNLIAIEDHKVLAYDNSGKETKYEVDVAYAVVERYAIVIKDNKLEIYDAVDDKVVHSFNIDSNLKFLSGVTPDFYYENEDGEHIIQVFLQDTSKEIDPETGRIYGKSFEYDFNTNEESVEDDYTIAYNE